jgi:hypothetical protein
MGIAKQTKPLHQQGWMKFLALSGKATTIYKASLAFSQPVRSVVICPACGQAGVIEHDAERPPLVFLGR